MMFLNKYKTIILAVLIAALVVLFWQWRKERTNRIRLQDNQSELISEPITYRLKDRSQVAQFQQLNLTFREFKQAQDSSFSALKARLYEMNIKLRKIESVSRAEIVNTKEIITSKVSDTLIFDTIQARTWKYADRWYNIKALEWENNRKVSINYRDELTQVVYKEGRSWKIWKRKFWQRPKYRQIISFTNPNTSINYPQYINIVK